MRKCYTIQPNVHIYFDSETKEITKLISTNLCAVNVVIPDQLEDGTKLTKFSRRGGLIEGDFNCITFSDGITEIGDGSFRFATVKKVIWPKKCDIIPDNCFEDSSICSIENISHVTHIGKYAFARSKIMEIQWPDYCRIIKEGTFEDSWICKIENIQRVIGIGSNAFYGTNIESFTVPKGVTAISPSTFKCSECNEIILHDKITKIGNGAFSYTNIKTIKWPSKCGIIPRDCFRYCMKLECIDGISNVVSIGNAAFEKCEELKQFDWPLRCETVPQQCFYGCKKLKNVNIHDKVKRIKANAFSGTGLDKFTWPSACNVIPSYCFCDSELSELTNLDNIEKIEYGAFFQSRLKKADFSMSLFTYKHCIFSCEMRSRENIILPYYYDNESVRNILFES